MKKIITIISLFVCMHCLSQEAFHVNDLQAGSSALTLSFDSGYSILGSIDHYVGYQSRGIVSTAAINIVDVNRPLLRPFLDQWHSNYEHYQYVVWHPNSSGYESFAAFDVFLQPYFKNLPALNVEVYRISKQWKEGYEQLPRNFLIISHYLIPISDDDFFKLWCGWESLNKLYSLIA